MVCVNHSIGLIHLHACWSTPILSGQGDVLGTHPDGTHMSPDEDPMAVALKEGRTIRGAEAVAERPDGSRIWITPYPTPLRDADGSIVGGINMLVDITDRKRAEEALTQSHENLRRSLDELERFNRVAVERELHITEKKEVNELCREQGQARRYPLAFEDTHANAQSMYAQEEIGHA